MTEISLGVIADMQLAYQDNHRKILDKSLDLFSLEAEIGGNIVDRFIREADITALKAEIAGLKFKQASLEYTLNRYGYELPPCDPHPTVDMLAYRS